MVESTSERDPGWAKASREVSDRESPDGTMGGRQAARHNGAGIKMAWPCKNPRPSDWPLPSKKRLKWRQRWRTGYWEAYAAVERLQLSC